MILLDAPLRNDSLPDDIYGNFDFLKALRVKYNLNLLKLLF